jgi:hypothetical protein
MEGRERQMVVKELAIALLKCKDQEADVYFNEELVTSCDEIVWDERLKEIIGRPTKTRVQLSGDTNYEEGGYGKAA